MEGSNNSELIAKYNEIKQKYTLYFQKSIELEGELREHKYAFII